MTCPFDLNLGGLTPELLQAACYTPLFFLMAFYMQSLVLDTEMATRRIKGMVVGQIFTVSQARRPGQVSVLSGLKELAQHNHHTRAGVHCQGKGERGSFVYFAV